MVFELSYDDAKKIKPGFLGRKWEEMQKLYYLFKNPLENVELCSVDYGDLSELFRELKDCSNKYQKTGINIEMYRERIYDFLNSVKYLSDTTVFFRNNIFLADDNITKELLKKAYSDVVRIYFYMAWELNKLSIFSFDKVDFNILTEKAKIELAIAAICLIEGGSRYYKSIFEESEKIISNFKSRYGAVEAIKKSYKEVEKLIENGHLERFKELMITPELQNKWNDTISHLKEDLLIVYTEEYLNQHLTPLYIQ